jgi:hypothetical protein
VIPADVVPGYTIDPRSGREDPTWRERYFTWHRTVRDWRVDSHARCLRDEEYRDLIDTLCARDTAFFVTHWLDVEEPRAVSHAEGELPPLDLTLLDSFEGLTDFEGLHDYQTIHPMIPYAYQVRGMQTFDHVVFNPMYRSRRLNVLWDKARGVGFTYSMLAAAYKNWLYRKGLRGTILTEKWDKADRTHSLNTLFGKLDLFFDCTPDWKIPPGFRSKGEKEAHRLKGTLVNPANGSQINTEPTTASSTRSGREAYIMIDEGAFQEYLDELWATALGTTFHLFAWSTASWQEGQQWQSKVDEGKKDTSGTTKVIEIDYWEHPAQDEAWKRETQAQFTAAGLAEQFEVEYLRNAGAGSGTLVYKTQVDRCPIISRGYDPRRPLYQSVDPGVEDATAWVWWQTHFVDGKKRIHILDSYEIAKMPVEFHAHLITGIPPRAPDSGKDFPGDAAWPLWAEGFFGEREQQLMAWLREVDPTQVETYGDPSVLTKDYSHESFAVKLNLITTEIREAAGVQPIPIFPMGASWKPIYKRNNFNERRSGARKALMYTDFEDNDGAFLLYVALGRTRFQEVTGRTTRPPGHIHDAYSHRVQAFEFGMLWETLELTPEELKPQQIEKPKGLHRGRKAHSRYQRQGKSLMGVA